MEKRFDAMLGFLTSFIYLKIAEDRNPTLISAFGPKQGGLSLLHAES